MQWGMLLALIMLLAGCGSGGDGERSSQASAPKTTPVRAALTDERTLLVSDYQSQSVQVVDEKLALVKSLAIDGYPLAVGFFDGRIYVGNESKQCVEVYSSATGAKLFDLGTGPGSVLMPNDLAIDAVNRRVYVVDSGADRILVFDADGPGAPLATISTPSVSLPNPMLIRPTAIVLDAAASQLYVSMFGGDGRPPAVLVFDVNGTLVRTITGGFSRPQGLALDDGNRLFLVDACLGQVFVLDRTTGQELQRLGDLAPYVGQHKLTLDVVWDGVTQKLFVTDYLLGRVVTFNLTGGTP